MNTQKNSNGNRFSSQIIIILIIAGAFAMGWFVSARLAGPGMTGMPPGMMGAGGPPAVKVFKVKKEYIEKEVPRVTELLEGYIPEIDSEVITIKLTELLKHTESLIRGNRVKDVQITNLMKLYELENEISNVIANPDSIPFVQHND